MDSTSRKFVIITRQWPNDGLVAAGFGNPGRSGVPIIDPPIILQIAYLHPDGHIETK